VNWQFVVEASPTVGYGHLMRVMSMVQRCSHVNPEIVVHVVGVTNLGEFGWLSSECELVRFEFHPGQLMTERLRPASFTIVDGYGFSVSDLAALKSRSTILVRMIDMNMDLTGCEDVVVCIAPSVELKASPDMGLVTLLSGFEYALIREEILALREARLSGPRSDLVVVAIGGGNSQQLERSIAGQILLETSCQVALPVGSVDDSLMGRLDANQVGRLKAFERHEFLDLLRECRIAVVGAGVSTLECGCGGVPVISIVVAENQNGYATSQEIRQFADFVDGRSLEQDRVGKVVASRLASLRNLSTLEERGRKTIDGLGPQRIVDFLIELKERAS
jgi:spore coat polysaccharide biosynthesis predicted glycosyltransferase SpsG